MLSALPCPPHLSQVGHVVEVLPPPPPGVHGRYVRQRVEQRRAGTPACGAFIKVCCTIPNPFHLEELCVQAHVFFCCSGTAANLARPSAPRQRASRRGASNVAWSPAARRSLPSAAARHRRWLRREFSQSPLALRHSCLALSLAFLGLLRPSAPTRPPRGALKPGVPALGGAHGVWLPRRRLPLPLRPPPLPLPLPPPLPLPSPPPLLTKQH
mgnify:CR=1 FL=1